MKKIGLTGGIGSGKSIVAKVFEKLGVPVFYADNEAARIQNLPEVVHELKLLLGDDVYQQGRLNRQIVRQRVFKNEDLLMKINEIIHPRVREQFLLFCDKYNNKPYVLQEAAILFESGAHKLMDKVITVYAPKELRIERAMLRDKASKETIESIIAKQMDDEQKKQKADYIIINDNKELLVPQVIDINIKLTSH